MNHGPIFQKIFISCILLFISGTGIAQSIDEIYFINEENRVSFIDIHSSEIFRIVNIEIEGAETYKQAIKLKKVNTTWLITSTLACTVSLKLSFENHKSETVNIRFIELPPAKYSFTAGYDLITGIEDSPPEVYKRENIFLDSLKQWELLYPEFELKNTIYVLLPNLPKDLFTKTDSSVIDLIFKDKVIIPNYKFHGSQLPAELIHQIIKYPPENLIIKFKKIYVKFTPQYISKKYENISFDFRK